MSRTALRSVRKPPRTAVDALLLRRPARLRGTGALVFMPVRNEERTIADVVAGIRRSCDLDLLVLDDGSTDATPAILERLDVEVLRRRSGAGSRIVDGLRVGLELGYDYVIKIDGDGQHDARDIPRLLEHTISTRADIVIGSRHLWRFDGSRLGVRGSGMWFCSWLVSLLYGRRITDTTSGFKVWSRRACRAAVRAHASGKLRQASTYHVEELMLALRRRLVVREVGVIIAPRRHGQSKSFAPRRLVAFPVELIRSTVRAVLVP